jgi:hypothetical protein
MNAKRLFGAGLAVLLAITYCGIGFAEEAKKAEAKKEPTVKSVVKEVQGEVSWARKNSISLVYGRNTEKGEESEVLLPLNPSDLKIVHKRSYGDISSGDTVLVQYVEETYDYGDRLETKLKAKVITYLKPRDEKSPYKGLDLTTKESLPLKGVKSDEK